MAQSLMLSKEDALPVPAAGPSREEVIARYRRLRAISKKHNSAILKFLPRHAVLQHGRRIGLARGRTFFLDSMDELPFAFDLAIHTAPSGRSRAVERYARSARVAPGSEEARVLEAMCDARFSLVRVERRHAAAGLIVTDVLRERELWLMDEGLERSTPDGSVLATRYYMPDAFAMTAGVLVPLDGGVFEDVLDEMPQLRRKRPREAADDHRLAEAVYRVAVARGTMERVRLQDVGSTDRADDEEWGGSAVLPVEGLLQLG